MENQIFRNHSSFCLRNLTTAFFLPLLSDSFVLYLSPSALCPNSPCNTLIQRQRANDRGFRPGWGIFNPLVRVAIVTADLVVEPVDSQVTKAGGIGAEMVVRVAVILAVEVALVFPFSSVTKNNNEKNETGRG